MVTMKKTIAGATVFFALSTAAFAEGGAVSWAHEGEMGAENWAALSADFAICGDGMKQSPIDLTDAAPYDADNIMLNWNAEATWEIVNNGHTVQANAANGGDISIAGQTYDLLQFHFHMPSEHAVNGERFAMEVHFVHLAESGALAVLGVMIVGGGENALFDEIMAAAPVFEDGHAAPAPVPVGAADAGALLPANDGFFRYEGSLTTPPCSETVLWTVLTEPVAVSDEAVAAFTAMYDMNARPLQALNDRELTIEN